MHLFSHMPFDYPPQSYSRQLDDAIARQEMPYGYDMPPPAADTGDYNSQKLVSKKEYPMKKGRAV
jgi:hypothetical protein